MNENNENNLRKRKKAIFNLNHLSNSITITKNIGSVLKNIKNEKAINIIKSELDEKLLKLFSSQPTPCGYNKDIESLLKDMNLTLEDIFNISLDFLSKSSKNENETRIIASYLFSMQGLTNLLLETINPNDSFVNKEKHLLNDLLVLGNTLEYEKFQKNTILIRFGEKGSKAYINLSGDVAVLIKKSYRLLLTEDEYLFYLINLIKYKEYELANITINENFKILPIEIIDDINEDNFKKFTHSMSTKDIDKFNSFNYIENSDIRKKSSRDISNYSLNNSNKLNNDANSKNKPKLKLNQENKKFQEISFNRKIFASDLMKTYNLKKINKRLLNRCNIEEYINRLNTIEGFNFDESQYNKKYQNIKEKFYFTIYSYINVVNLKKGSIFGEMALNNKNSLRTATIITLDDCFCGVLNKKTYNNCLRNGAIKNLYDILNFIVELPIFKGIPQSIFYKKYYTSLSRNSLNKNNRIITQGDSPDYIALLKSGQYTIYIYNSLYNITNLMAYYMTITQKIQRNEEMAHKIILSLKSTNKLLIGNEKFKEYYFSKNNFKVGEISCPDIIGYNEYLDEDGKYAFSIEIKSIHSDFFLLKNDLYKDIMNKTDIVKINQDEVYYSKLNLIIERLYNVRKTAINSFMEYKTNEKIGNTISKEIDDALGNRIKYKRLKKLNSTNFKMPLIQKDNINNIINNDNYLLYSMKKSYILNPTQPKIKILGLISNEINKTEKNFNNTNNNINEKGKTFSKVNNFLELIDTNKSFSKNPKKNNIINFNKTESNLNNNKNINNFLNLKSNAINIFIKKVKEKIETYKEKTYNTNNKKEFDGICLNNMILEDIKDKIKLPLYETPREKKIYRRNNNFIRKNMIFIPKRFYNSVRQNKFRNEIAFPSLSDTFLKGLTLFKKNKKKEKINKTKLSYDKINNEVNKSNYGTGRNNYYEKNISKRLNYFFGNKKNNKKIII